MKIIAGLLASLFLVSVNIEMSKSQAATAIAYASLHQEKKVDPKPDPGEVLAKAKCADQCKCVKCECTECECLNPVKEVKWVQTSNTTGEHQYLENGKVTATRKWALTTTYVRSCNGRSCTLIPVRKWVLLK